MLLWVKPQGASRREGPRGEVLARKSSCHPREEFPPLISPNPSVSAGTGRKGKGDAIGHPGVLPHPADTAGETSLAPNSCVRRARPEGGSGRGSHDQERPRGNPSPSPSGQAGGRQHGARLETCCTCVFLPGGGWRAHRRGTQASGYFFRRRRAATDGDSE